MAYLRSVAGVEALDAAHSLNEAAVGTSVCYVALPVGPHLDVEDMNHIAESLKTAIGV